MMAAGFSRPMVMGIVNITPDSFSGDGVMRQTDYVAAALAQAERMFAEGAELIDIGGESTRPGATPLSAQEEIRRVVPVVAALTAKFGRDDTARFPRFSIDTFRAATAEAALDAGAGMINDISGGQHDAAMLPLAAKRHATIVLMHNRGMADAVTQHDKLGGAYLAPAYGDVVVEARDALAALAADARAAGIEASRIILDPGIGFGKTVAQNSRLINELDRFNDLGYPLLVGPSRKNFIGQILDLPPEDRLEGTAAVVAVCVMRGAAILRVHDVKTMSRTVRMTAAVVGLTMNEPRTNLIP